MSHTPGPWTVERRELSSLIWGSGANGHLAIVHQFSGSMRPGQDEAIANARLIAASPDLLALARRIVRLADDAGIAGPLAEEARAAIARVEQQP